MEAIWDANILCGSCSWGNSPGSNHPRWELSGGSCQGGSVVWEHFPVTLFNNNLNINRKTLTKHVPRKNQFVLEYGKF